ncbi:MAG: vanadium-dependent haloperoxidase [Chitinophagaceae bacterium]
MKKVVAFFCLATVLAACSNDQDKSYVKVTSDPLLFSKTVKNLNDIVLENNFPPMVAARNYAYANIAAYECISAGNPSYKTLSGQIKHMPMMPKPANGEIDFSMAALLAFVKVGNAVTFPEGSMMNYYDQLSNMADSIGMPAKMLENTKAFSDTIAAAILLWSKGDNYSATRGASRHSISDSPGRWVPTPPMYATGLEPHWMEIRPLVMDSASQFKPVRPPLFDIQDKNSIFYKSLLQVKNTGDSLTDEQKHIADFWDDNPFKMNVSGHVMYATKKFSPAGHWMNITGIGAKKANADFNTTVAAYAKTAIALFDAFISCWDEKYRSNYIRPETVINKLINQEWRPYIQTPPFPSYTSGHSTISAAAAEVMTEYFGDKLSFTDTSLLEFGIANREIKSFRDAAQEASISRLYGGIHYMFDLNAGNESGRKVGSTIVEKLNMRKR